MLAGATKRAGLALRTRRGPTGFRCGEGARAQSLARPSPTARRPSPVATRRRAAVQRCSGAAETVDGGPGLAKHSSASALTFSEGPSLPAPSFVLSFSSPSPSVLSPISLGNTSLVAPRRRSVSAPSAPSAQSLLSRCPASVRYSACCQCTAFCRPPPLLLASGARARAPNLLALSRAQHRLP